MSINTPEEHKEQARKVTLAFGSLIVDSLMEEISVVYDVGSVTAVGPPIKACHILDERKNLLAWSGSMYPYQVKTVLQEVWPESRVIEAFVSSYHMRREEVLYAMGQIENRGPRVFTV